MSSFCFCFHFSYLENIFCIHTSIHWYIKLKCSVSLDSFHEIVQFSFLFFNLFSIFIVIHFHPVYFLHCSISFTLTHMFFFSIFFFSSHFVIFISIFHFAFSYHIHRIEYIWSTPPKLNKCYSSTRIFVFFFFSF